jgi:hypothetical protein
MPSRRIAKTLQVGSYASTQRLEENDGERQGKEEADKGQGDDDREHLDPNGIILGAAVPCR